MPEKYKLPTLVGAHQLRLLLVVALVAQLGQCVNLDKCDQLAKEDLLELDREVSRFYYDTYEELHNRNISYNDQLFTSIRAIRHTNALNQFDYVYSDEKIMRNSAGKQVNLERCLRQLEALEGFARQVASYRKTGEERSFPMSVIDMLEASARPESGVLNGNFIWLGSPASCQHARISSKHLGQRSSVISSANSSDDIKGRYCIAHVRAKKWPKDDKYFGDRITLRAGLCVPESCHSNMFVDSPEVRSRVESLTKSNMVAPFNGDQYEVGFLYCLPDEDSPHRQWDLGTKMFVLFVALWSLLLLYSNIKYQRRLKAMKKLSESIDIKMIVEQDLHSANRDANLMPPSSGEEGSSSNGATPIPSDDDEEQLPDIKSTFVGKQRGDNRFDSNRRPGNLGPFDFVKAFAVKANIDFLFRRADFINSKPEQQQQNSISTVRRVSQQQQQQQQQQSSASPASRRLSASNAALIKDLERESGKTSESTNGSSNHNKLNVVDSQQANADPSKAEQLGKTKRVNIDVLDGIKVFATGYIVYAHTLMFFFGILTDLRFVPERMMDFTTIATINGLQVVGLFYIITGVLISYLAFSRQKVKRLLQPSFWTIAIIGRYLRLLPTYLLVFWFAKHVAPFTGSGPFWLEYRTDSQHPRGYCSGESWLTMLTMSAADIKIPYDCVPQTWYLSNDFRTLFILPFYIIILALNTAAGYAAILSTIMFSTFKMTQILREANIDYRVMLHWQPHVFNMLSDRLHDVYTNLSIRLSTYLLGVIVGHILYLYETGQIKRMPRWFRRFGLKLALVVGSMSFMGAPLIACACINQFLPSPENVDSDTVVMLIPLLKTTMELCICVTLLSLTTGGGFKWLTEILSSQPARVLSNISYGVFLIHVEVMYKTPISKFESDYFFLFLYSAYYILLSNIIAFFIHVLYEMPINNVLRHSFKTIFHWIAK